MGECEICLSRLLRFAAGSPSALDVLELELCDVWAADHCQPSLQDRHRRHRQDYDTGRTLRVPLPCTRSIGVGNLGGPSFANTFFKFRRNRHRQPFQGEGGRTARSRNHGGGVQMENASAPAYAAYRGARRKRKRKRRSSFASAAPSASTTPGGDMSRAGRLPSRAHRWKNGALGGSTRSGK